MSLVATTVFQNRKISAQVWRLSEPINGHKEYFDTGTSIQIDIQNLSDKEIALYDGGATVRLMKGYCDISVDLQPTDKLVTSDYSYKVKTILDYRTLQYRKLFLHRLP